MSERDDTLQSLTDGAGSQRPDSGPDIDPVAVVLGGSRGLGLLIARELLRRGHGVLEADRDTDALASAKGLLQRSPVDP